MLIENGKKGLNEAPDGTVVEWSNPATRSSGSLNPLNTSEKGGLKCRNVEFVNKHKTIYGGGCPVTNPREHVLIGRH